MGDVRPGYPLFLVELQSEDALGGGNGPLGRSEDWDAGKSGYRRSKRLLGTTNGIRLFVDTPVPVEVQVY
jgi:hypothetical protein